MFLLLDAIGGGGGKERRKGEQEKEEMKRKGKEPFPPEVERGANVEAKRPEKEKKKPLERNPETFLTKAIELEVSLWTNSIWHSRSL